LKDFFRGERISYFHLGVATAPGVNLDTLHNIVNRNNHTNSTISYLKVCLSIGICLGMLFSYLIV
jgi:hypothetical protein